MITHGVSIQTTSKCRPAVRGKDLSDLLYDLISIATPHGHEHMLHPVLKAAIRLGKSVTAQATDPMGNMYVQVGERAKTKTMFSCHIDTSHVIPGKGLLPPFIVPMVVDYDGGDKLQENGMIYGAQSSFSAKLEKEIYIPSILGADDKVGVYLLLCMIQADIPGLYVFHVGEERGCIGSTYSSKHNKDLFKGFERCIAFDRMNYGDVITKQKGKRTASIAFSEAFAENINKFLPANAPKFKKDVVGMYTDSANYTGIIPECTNISVGYWDQHGSTERFDSVWVEKILKPAVLQIDFEKLPTVRKITDPEYDATHYPVTQLTRVKFEQTTPTTAHHMIEEWSIDQGLIIDIPDNVMLRIIEARVRESTWGAKSDAFAKQIFEFLKRYQHAIDIAEEEEYTPIKAAFIDDAKKKPDLAPRNSGEKKPDFKLSAGFLNRIDALEIKDVKEIGRIAKAMDEIVKAGIKLLDAYAASENLTRNTPMHLAIGIQREKFYKFFSGLLQEHEIPNSLDLQIAEFSILELACKIGKLPGKMLTQDLNDMIEFILDTWGDGE